MDQKQIDQMAHDKWNQAIGFKDGFRFGFEAGVAQQAEHSTSEEVEDRAGSSPATGSNLLIDIARECDQWVNATFIPNNHTLPGYMRGRKDNFTFDEMVLNARQGFYAGYEKSLIRIEDETPAQGNDKVAGTQPAQRLSPDYLAGFRDGVREITNGRDGW